MVPRKIDGGGLEMNVDEAVQAILGRYMGRVQVKAGNGLSKCMNQNLRSYEQIPLIITRTVTLLAGTESLFGFSGAVRLYTLDLYRTLMDLHDDWVEEVPQLGRRSEQQAFVDTLLEAIEAGEPRSVPKARGTVDFVRRPLLPFHQFTAAWTIGRRIGVLEGRGELGLTRTTLAELRRLASQGETASSVGLGE